MIKLGKNKLLFPILTLNWIQRTSCVMSQQIRDIQAEWRKSVYIYYNSICINLVSVVKRLMRQITHNLWSTMAIIRTGTDWSWTSVGPAVMRWVAARRPTADRWRSRRRRAMVWDWALAGTIMNKQLTLLIALITYMDVRWLDHTHGIPQPMLVSSQPEMPGMRIC